jgi:hypothetical protein
VAVVEYALHMGHLDFLQHQLLQQEIRVLGISQNMAVDASIMLLERHQFILTTVCLSEYKGV